MSAEFPNQLQCLEDCLFQRKCATRLLLDTEKCKVSVKNVLKQAGKSFLNDTLDYQVREENIIVIVFTQGKTPLWIARAQPEREWIQITSYKAGELENSF